MENILGKNEKTSERVGELSSRLAEYVERLDQSLSKENAPAETIDTYKKSIRLIMSQLKSLSPGEAEEIFYEIARKSQNKAEIYELMELSW